MESYLAIDSLQTSNNNNNNNSSKFLPKTSTIGQTRVLPIAQTITITIMPTQIVVDPTKYSITTILNRYHKLDLSLRSGPGNQLQSNHLMWWQSLAINHNLIAITSFLRPYPIIIIWAIINIFIQVILPNMITYLDSTFKGEQNGE